MAAQSPHSNTTVLINHGVHALRIPAVKAVPFSATEELIASQSLSDGNTLSKHMRLLVGRDTRGWTHQESRQFQGDYDSGDSPLRAMVLFDPATKIRTYIYPRSQTATLVKAPQIPSNGSAPVSLQEPLGMMTLEGQLTEGTRYMRITHEAPERGREATITDEIWYSEELKCNVLMKHVDPRYGVVTMRLTDIVRGEPASEMFQIPAGYRIIDDLASDQ